MTQISGYLFCECGNLSSLEIHDNIESIDKFAFYGCTSLPNFTIPLKVTQIPESVFYGCSSLSSFEIHDNVTLIDKFGRHKKLHFMNVNVWQISQFHQK